jgi:MoxR-like ATPase
MDANAQKANEKLKLVKAEMSKAIVGQKELIDRLIIALLADGHVILEGVPGIAKTLAVNTFAKTLSLGCKRIQFTPDLLPSDLIGTSIYNPKEGTFFVQKGPVFTNVVLADEINRAPPKVQSALLEIMQEKQVTIGGETFHAPLPFMVLATQNPIEQEGTYPLPEAETDRFMMKIKIGYPSSDEEKEIVKRMGSKASLPISSVMTADDITACRNVVQNIYVDEKILQYIVNIVFATRFPEQQQVDIIGLLDYGASPRASLALNICSKAHALMEGRAYVTPYDVKKVALDVLRHRLIVSYEAEAQSITAEMIIEKIFEKVAVP